MIIAMIEPATIAVLVAICLALIILGVLSLRSFDLEDHLRGGNIVHGRQMVTPEPPPEETPLDETIAPIHYEGDTGSV